MDKCPNIHCCYQISYILSSQGESDIVNHTRSVHWQKCFFVAYFSQFCRLVVQNCCLVVQNSCLVVANSVAGVLARNCEGLTSWGSLVPKGPNAAVKQSVLLRKEAIGLK